MRRKDHPLLLGGAGMLLDAGERKAGIVRRLGLYPRISAHFWAPARVVASFIALFSFSFCSHAYEIT
jgi:hypothetical protein